MKYEYTDPDPYKMTHGFETLLLTKLLFSNFLSKTFNTVSKIT